MGKTRQLELVEHAKGIGAYVLCDEVYRFLEHDERDRLPAMSDVYDKGVSCGALSKPWGACGVTIGWLVTQVTFEYRLLVVFT